MNILLCCTHYVLLQYFLLMPFERFRETFFVFDDYFDTAVVQRLEQQGMVCHQLRFRRPPTSVEEIKKARWDNCCRLVELVHAFIQQFHGDVHFYGQDHCNVSHILWEKSIYELPFTLLEDGIGNYRTKASLQHQFGEMASMFPYLAQGEMFFGHNSRANEIFLTGLWKIPDDLKSRAKIIDLKGLWKRKSTKEKEFLLNTYHIDAQMVQDIAARRVCLLTSHFSREGLMSSESELMLYEKMVAGVPDEDTFVKLHPLFDLEAELRAKFPGMLVFSDPVPFEILYFFIESKLEKVLTLEFSTACAIVSENTEVEIWGRDGSRIERPVYWQGFV